MNNYKRAWNQWKKIYPVLAGIIEWECRLKDDKPKECWYMMAGHLQVAVTTALADMDTDRCRKVLKMLRKHEKIETECGLKNGDCEPF